MADAASPEGAKARVVVAPYGSQTAADALAHGKNVLTVSGWDGKSNVSLGWWSMGNQVGTALAKGHPALAGLPHEGALTPLLFRVVKEGAHAMSRKDLAVASPVIVGEGKKDCFLKNQLFQVLKNQKNFLDFHFFQHQILISIRHFRQTLHNSIQVYLFLSI